MIKHVFFDLDRTLWDFESNSDLTLRQLFLQFELNLFIESPEKFIAEYKKINSDYWNNYRLGKTTKEALRTGRFVDTMNHFGIANQIDAEKFGEAYLSVCPTLTQLFPGTKTMLETLKQKGLHLHIITNGFTEAQEVKMDKCGLNPFFDVILCSDTIGINKPDKKIFLEALRRANAQPSESVMVGDHPDIDVLGASAVGMRGILFNPENIPCSPFMEEVNHWDDFAKMI